MSQSDTILYETATGTQGPVVDLLDQTKLPLELSRLRCTTPEQLHDAIVRLVVRGAPAIGIAVTYGVTLAAVPGDASLSEAKSAYLNVIDYLATSRPTAVNLFWALDRMREVVEAAESISANELLAQLAHTAAAIHDDDRQMCLRIGEHGAAVLAGHSKFLTHCNAGGLATSTLGTALAPFYHMHRSGTVIKVYADETRPLLQGARLTAWELAAAGIDVTVCTDSMAGSLMRRGEIDAVIVGADRIAVCGDVANKIGTYSVAVLARHHGLPFYVAAPTNTFDTKLSSGDEIPIEQRSRKEVTYPGGPQGYLSVPDQAKVINPAFDVTPAELVTGIITQRGVISAPTKEKVLEHLT